MRNPAGDDAVERMLSQIEDLLKRQQAGARAPVPADTTGETSPFQSSDTTLPPRHDPRRPELEVRPRPRMRDLLDDETAADTSPAYDPDATQPEALPYDPEAIVREIRELQRPPQAVDDAPREVAESPAPAGAAPGAPPPDGAATAGGRERGPAAAAGATEKPAAHATAGIPAGGHLAPPRDAIADTPVGAAADPGTPQSAALSAVRSDSDPLPTTPPPAAVAADAPATPPPAAVAPDPPATPPAPLDVAVEPHLDPVAAPRPHTAPSVAVPGADAAPAASAAAEAPADDTDDTSELPAAANPDAASAGHSNGTHMTRRLTTRLGRLLTDADLLTEAQLQDALRKQRDTGERLGAVLVNEGYIDEPALLSVLESQYGVPAARLDDAELDPALTKLIPYDMARRNLIVPLALHADAVDVAMVDPTDFVAMAHVRFAAGLRPNVFITTVHAARRAIARLYAEEGEDPAPDQPLDRRQEIKRMILDRDSLLMAADQDPRKFYQLAATIDAFVEEILRKADAPR